MNANNTHTTYVSSCRAAAAVVRSRAVAVGRRRMRRTAIEQAKRMQQQTGTASSYGRGASSSSSSSVSLLRPRDAPSLSPSSTLPSPPPPPPPSPLPMSLVNTDVANVGAAAAAAAAAAVSVHSTPISFSAAVSDVTMSEGGGFLRAISPLPADVDVVGAQPVDHYGCGGIVGKMLSIHVPLMMTMVPQPPSSLGSSANVECASPSREAQVAAARSVLKCATNPVFDLCALSEQNAPCDYEVDVKRQVIFFEMLLRCPQWNGNPNFMVLSADHLAVLMRLYDREFFGGCIGEIFDYHCRTIFLHCVDSMPTQAGHFSRRGFDHHLAVCAPVVMASFSNDADSMPTQMAPVYVCGHACHNRLEALMRVFEHELCHLLCFSNYFTVDDPHGAEFEAVAYGFFRHKACTHQLKTGWELASSYATLHPQPTCVSSTVQYVHRVMRDFIN